MKNKLLYISLLCLTIIACVKPDLEEPIELGVGLNTIKATYTSGAEIYQEAGSVIIADDIPDRIVIPIPWFSPEDSNNETTEAIKAMRVEAGLDNNFEISPVLTTLDLTQENRYTITNLYGEKKSIIITGERTKSNKCNLTFLTVENEKSFINVTGTINQEKNEVTLITANDLSEVMLNLSVSPHATYKLENSNLSINEPLNLNSEIKIVVVAHNGIDTKTYTVVKRMPEKINYGIRKGSELQLWSKNFTLDGITQTSNGITTLASIGNNLILSMGNGEAPIYYNRMTGEKLGRINKGSAKGNGVVTNDDAGNLLIIDAASPGDKYTIYRTSSITDAPVEFFSMITPYLRLARATVQGDIDGDALIVAAYEESNSFMALKVTGGVVGVPEVITVNGVGGPWWGNQQSPGLVSKTVNLADGYFLDFYDKNVLHYINGTTHTSEVSMTGGNGLENDNRLASKTFNNATYLVLGSIPHFPQWGGEMKTFLFDVTSTASFTGNTSTSPALVHKFIAPKFTGNDNGILAEGDVMLAPTVDGYKMFLFYVDNNTKSLGAIEFDCIDE